MLKLRLLSQSVVVAGLVLGIGALSGAGDRAEAQATPEATLAAAVDAWNDEDIETFVSYFTPGGLEFVFGITPDEAIDFLTEDRAGTGPIASAELVNERLSGNVLTAEVDIQFEGGFSLYQGWEFTMTEDGWKISGGMEVSRPIPAGVPVVDLDLQEYAFVYNEAAIQAADGNFAFSVANIGQEDHEVVILGIDSDEPLLDLLMSADPESEDLPQGLEFLTFGGFFSPGGEGTVVFDQPLAPGKYGMVCFVPSPEGIPHAFLGMISEFTIGSGPVDGGGATPITPPSTGNAGLLDAGAGHAMWAVLALAATLVLGGVAGLARSRARL